MIPNFMNNGFIEPNQTAIQVDSGSQNASLIQPVRNANRSKPNPDEKSQSNRDKQEPEAKANVEATKADQNQIAETKSTYDEKSGAVVVETRNKKTRELIARMPSENLEEFLKTADRGLLIDEKV